MTQINMNGWDTTTSQITNIFKAKPKRSKALKQLE